MTGGQEEGQAIHTSANHAPRERMARQAQQWTCAHVDQAGVPSYMCAAQLAYWWRRRPWPLGWLARHLAPA